MLEARLLTLGKSQESLEVELANIQGELLGGRTVSAWTMGDSSATKNIWLNLPPQARLRIVAEALSILDPTSYPPDFCQAIVQTRPVFS